MPAPIRPPPTIAIDRGRVISLSCGVSAVRVDDVPGMEIRGARTQKQQRAGQIVRLTQTADGNSCQKSGPHVVRLLVIFEHPCGERGAEYRRCDGVDGNTVLTPFTAQRLG